MSLLARDGESRRSHLEWIGYVQPTGLLVSAPALADCGAFVNRNIVPEHKRFLDALATLEIDGNRLPIIDDLPRFLTHALGWRPTDTAGAPGGPSLPEDLEVALPEYGETLRPTFAVPAVDGGSDPAAAGNPAATAVPAAATPGTPAYQLLILQTAPAADLDAPVSPDDDRRWQASPQARLERLLRETRVPIGLLCNATSLRLVYAPRGESSGYATFHVKEMAEVAGRPIFAALHMLLSDERLFTLPERQRLPAILLESRKYQNVVSTQLAQQVLAALYELLRGFQAADAQRRNELLHEVLREDPDHVYAGLLTVLLRLVFLLYAEDRDLISSDAVYANHYSVTGLFARLRADAGAHPDTMDQRYGAWAQLLTTFRLIHDGARHGTFALPARHGGLFDPDRFNFLEGRPWRVGRVIHERIDPPMVADGVVYRILQNLLILDGERISYRSLDVEQIGSVYEAMMGFHLRVAAGRSIAVRSKKRHGAPITVNLDAILAVKPEDRAKRLREETDRDVAGKAQDAVKKAKTPEDLAAALEKLIARDATPNIVPAGDMILQPSDERRRSGSHYTPRSLTEPIVRTTLRPILERLGADPTPEQVLKLKVCDPAMGSGAFLVEACRQLADVLIRSWHAHGCLPRIPADEDEVLHARRRIAQRCLYGVDKNPLAVDLAKLSLWLATLAKDHAFTFLDHALRHGDSLVGLTRRQIESFHWKEYGQMGTIAVMIRERLDAAATLRQEIQDAGDDAPESVLRDLHARAVDAVDEVTLIGDLVVEAFFSAEKDKDREKRRAELAGKVDRWLSDDRGFEELHGLALGLREQERSIVPFHWEIEFPEVFGRENPGFDAVVGNPPFAGKNTLINGNAPGYLDWLMTIHDESNGNSDIVAHFFRRMFGRLRASGGLGLIATNTIAQGDTRAAGLRWICTRGGTIFAARRRVKWPGEAAVVVSVVHVAKGEVAGPFDLDGREVPIITAFLFHGGGHDDPARLAENAGKSFQGSIVLGMGFTFDDTDKKGVASPISEMHRLIAKDPRNAERIFPYIGGEEVNDSPTHAHHRYVINFEDMTEEEAWRWPDLMKIVEERVKPERMKLGDNPDALRRKRCWWLWGRHTPALFAAIRGMERVLVISRVSNSFAFTFLHAPQVYSERLVIIVTNGSALFTTLQSRPHEIWTRAFGSTLKDDLLYTPSDCFETFPFPPDYETDPALEAAGRAYYNFRAELMIRNDEGLTKTYNRFHDPEETSPDIAKLRDLHAAMDRAVLDAYGWTDLAPTCEFLLDYEDEDPDSDDPDTPTPTRTRKKPWRYRWPDPLRDEVLARLLALNHELSQEADQHESLLATRTNGRRTSRTRSRRSPRGANGPLFFETGGEVEGG